MGTMLPRLRVRGTWPSTPSAPQESPQGTDSWLPVGTVLSLLPNPKMVFLQFLEWRLCICVESEAKSLSQSQHRAVSRKQGLAIPFMRWRRSDPVLIRRGKVFKHPSDTSMNEFTC